MAKVKNAPVTDVAENLLDSVLQQPVADRQSKTGTLLDTVMAEPCSIASFAGSVRHNCRSARSADDRKGLRASLVDGIKTTSDGIIMVVPITASERDREMDARRSYYDSLEPERQKRFESAGYLDSDRVLWAPVNGVQRSTTVCEMILDGKPPKGKLVWRADVYEFDTVADMIAASIAANERDTTGKLTFDMPERLDAAIKLYEETQSRQKFIDCFRPGTGPKLLGIITYDRKFPNDKLIEKVRRFWADQAAERAKPRGIDFRKIDQSIGNMASATKPMPDEEVKKLVVSAYERTKSFRPSKVMNEKKLRALGTGTKCPLVRFVVWSILEGDANGLTTGLQSLDDRDLDSPAGYFGVVSDEKNIPDDDEE